jgi:hypothetical protein
MLNSQSIQLFLQGTECASENCIVRRGLTAASQMEGLRIDISNSETGKIRRETRGEKLGQS